MEVEEIKRADAIDKLVDLRMEYLVKEVSIFKAILKHGFFGYCEYDNYTLELLLRDKIDDSIKFKII
jgi:hypothetical protein